MVKTRIARIGIVPALISSVFYEVASNHHPEPHSNRVEVREQLARQATSLAPKSLRVTPPGSGGNIPEPAPAAELFSRENRRRERQLTPDV